MGVFIRKVTHDERRAGAIETLAAEVEADGAALHLVEDSLDAARHAARHGWIREEAVPAVALEVEADRRARDEFDELIETPPRATPSE